MIRPGADLLSLRLGSDTQKENAFIDALIEKIKAAPGSCDEVWFASDYGFPTLETHKKNAEALIEQAEKFRRAGVRVSMQISNSLGHGEHTSARDCSGLVCSGSAAEHMVGHDGIEAGYCFCWNGKHLREYLIKEIKYYVQALKPHTVWMDDDLRARNHAPVEYGCFCENCMKKFNSGYGCDFTREELVHEINFGKTSEWREKYIRFLRDSLYDFTYEIAKAVHEVSPETRMGYQNGCYGSYTGPDYDFIFDAMRKGTGHDPATRPGAGAYNDRDPNNFIDKMWTLGYLNSLLPDYVCDIRPEIESLPDVKFGKSIAGTCFETSLYLAGGATAMSYAILMNAYEPMEWHGQMLSAFAEHRKYWLALSEANFGTTQAGLKTVSSENFWRKKQTEGKNEMFEYSYDPPASLSPLLGTGIPIGFGNEKNPVYILRESVAERLTDGEAERLMRSPVFTSARALEILQNRGFEFGASAKRVDSTRLGAKYTSHKINRGFSSENWRGGWGSHSSYILTDLDGAAEPLTAYDTASPDLPPFFPGEKYPYGIADAIVRTGSGGLWAVFGLTPWDEYLSLDRRNQIIYAVDYISRDRLPAILETGLPATLLPREDMNGLTTSVSVVNRTVGESGPLTIRIRRPKSERFVFMSPREERKLDFIREKSETGEDYIVQTPSIAPWDLGTVFIK